jgi:hypothetical protein
VVAQQRPTECFADWKSEFGKASSMYNRRVEEFFLGSPALFGVCNFASRVAKLNTGVRASEPFNERRRDFSEIPGDGSLPFPR